MRATADQLTVNFNLGCEQTVSSKTAVERTPQSGIPWLGCSAKTTHHTGQCMFASPVVQKARAMDDGAVEKCDMVRRIILHHVLHKRMSARVVPTSGTLKLNVWFQQ